MGPVRTFASSYGRALTVAVSAVSAASLWSLVVAGGPAALVRSGAVPAFAIALTWSLFWRPQLEVSDGGLVVRNVFRTIRIPWPCLRGVDETWSLRLTTAEGAFTVWAAPARSSMGGFGQARRGSTTAAGLEVTRRWAALREAGYLDDEPVQEVHATITWHLATIVVLAGLAAIVLLARVAAGR